MNNPKPVKYDVEYIKKIIESGNIDMKDFMDLYYYNLSLMAVIGGFLQKSMTKKDKELMVNLMLGILEKFDLKTLSDIEQRLLDMEELEFLYNFSTLTIN